MNPVPVVTVVQSGRVSTSSVNSIQSVRKPGASGQNPSRQIVLLRPVPTVPVSGSAAQIPDSPKPSNHTPATLLLMIDSGSLGTSRSQDSARGKGLKMRSPADASIETIVDEASLRQSMKRNINCMLCLSVFNKYQDL